MAYKRFTRGGMRRAWQVAPLLFAVMPRALEAQAQLPPFIEMRVTKAPTIGQGNGTSFLAHELHVTNFQPAPFTLEKIEVLVGDADGRVLLTLQDSSLVRALSRPGIAPPPPFEERARVGGGLRAIAFLWVPLAEETRPRERATPHHGVARNG
jgi:hypothetical protein